MPHEYENIIPRFVRTMHLPIEPNASRNDLVAKPSVLKLIFENKNVNIEEKIDGANCGMTIINDHPVIRNRNHILSKAQSGRSRTPAKLQFAAIWNWFYSNAKKFEKLASELGFMPSIYGEWLYAIHSVEYDLLPDFFVAYDIYDYRRKIFLNPLTARSLLEKAGFSLPHKLTNPKVNTEDSLRLMRDGHSIFSSVSQREGIYIKTYDEDQILDRFKMVRKDFITDDHWNKKELRKNRKAK